MELHKHILDAIASPKCIRVSDNLWALRFESMKLASCAVAVETLLKNGTIDETTTLVDSSSGIYAYALALASHKYKLRCHIVASTTVDETLLLQLRTLGATIDQVPPSSSLKYDQELRVKRVHAYLERHSEAYWMQQYHNRIHYEGYRQIGAQIAELIRREGMLTTVNLVSPVGSGASSAGLHSGLTMNGTAVHLTGIQPFGSISFGSENISDPDILVAGIGSAIHFGNINYNVFDDIHWITAAIARHGAISLLADTGIFSGFSSGASYVVGRHIANLKKDILTLIICPDMGYRYSTLLSETDLCSPGVTEPVWISSLDKLAPPWSAMHWAGRSFKPISGAINLEEGMK